MEEHKTELSRHAAQQFATKWAAYTNEKQYAQSFWRDFFHNILGYTDLQDVGIQFEYVLKDRNEIRWIDVFLPGVALIEHKSAGRNLDEAETQARHYLELLAPALRPPVIILSDFARLRLIDVIAGTNIEFPLSELPTHLDRIHQIFTQQIVDITTVQAEADKQAAKLMANLYHALEASQFGTKPDNEKLHIANTLLARLLFCMFGDDTGMWPYKAPGLFHHYILDSRDDGQDLAGKLSLLFQVLNTPKNQRPTNLPEDLTLFPHVGSEIFNETVEVPYFDATMRQALLQAAQYDWSTISPAIFGALFQNVKTKEARHAGGEHYTSEKNILKVIRPLFLDDYTNRMWDAWDNPNHLETLRRELGTRNYLDPACGCGNFLVVTYRELRHLETQIIARVKQLKGTYGQVGLFGDTDLHVSLEQMHGIEVEDWPAQIARLALYLTDHQANVTLETITGTIPNRFPIQHAATITHGNALQVDWADTCPIDDNTIIMGNPPFLTNTQFRPEQASDQKRIWGGARRGASMDFVANWHLLAARNMTGTRARAAFVSTNSITQGEQPATLWAQLGPLGMEIDFAHRTFAWENGAGHPAERPNRGALPEARNWSVRDAQWV